MSDAAPAPGLDATLRDFSSGQRIFNRYTLIRTLGRGGMGIVWLAHDEVLDREVALKFLPEIIIHDRAVLDDLKRETKRSLELTHKNIVRIHDFVHDAVSACISMEYIEGDTLSNLRVDKPSKVFEPDELRPWLSQLCDALDYAHNHARIVHRDIKPSNLMISKRGELKIADFGIARGLSDSVSMLTHARGTSGTLLYMSPQQLDGERGTHLDDIYSIGAAIYELITSKPPFYSGNIDRQIREKIPPTMTERRKQLEVGGNPIPKNWDETIAACLAKDPTRRPQSVSEIARRLPLALPESPTKIVGRHFTTKDLIVMGGAAAALVLLVALFLSGAFGRRHSLQGESKKSEQPTLANQPGEKDFESAVEYFTGLNGARVNDAKAVELFRSAANQHLPEAEAGLAVWTKLGSHNIPKDSAKAEALARQALSDGLEAKAEHGRTAAQNALALLYRNGVGLQKDSNKMVALYQKAADAGDAEAQNNLGSLYEKGTGVIKDVIKAAQYYEKAADQGHVYAQANLGTLYEGGVGVAKDPSKAVKLYQKAADRGFPRAESSLGACYQNGTGISKDLSKALDLYQKAAEQGDLSAQTNLGWLYETGTGVTKDPNKAAELYQKAADRGFARAQNNLGACYQNGSGVTKDLSKAVEWYQKGANQNIAIALKNLGWCYLNGAGVTKDVNKAIELFQKAVDQGYARAQTELGWCYETGTGVTKDLNKAVELYQKSADQGEPSGQNNLGSMYETGTGVAKDLSKAGDLYRKAAEQGNEQAREHLHRLSGTSAEISSKENPVTISANNDQSASDVERQRQYLYDLYARNTAASLRATPSPTPAAFFSPFIPPVSHEFDGTWVGHDTGTPWTATLVIKDGKFATCTEELSEKLRPPADHWNDIAAPYNRSHTIVRHWTAESRTVEVTSAGVNIYWNEWKLSLKPNIPTATLPSRMRTPPNSSAGFIRQGPDLVTGKWSFHRAK